MQYTNFNIKSYHHVMLRKESKNIYNKDVYSYE